MMVGLLEGKRVVGIALGSTDGDILGSNEGNTDGVIVDGALDGLIVDGFLVGDLVDGEKDG